MAETANEQSTQLQELLPTRAQLYQELTVTPVLCKPKLLPLKSHALAQMEALQESAAQEVKIQEQGARGQAEDLLKEAHEGINFDNSHSQADSLVVNP